MHLPFGHVGEADREGMVRVGVGVCGDVPDDEGEPLPELDAVPEPDPDMDGDDDAVDEPVGELVRAEDFVGTGEDVGTGLVVTAAVPVGVGVEMGVVVGAGVFVGAPVPVTAALGVGVGVLVPVGAGVTVGTADVVAVAVAVGVAEHAEGGHEGHPVNVRDGVDTGVPVLDVVAVFCNAGTMEGRSCARTKSVQ